MTFALLGILAIFADAPAARAEPSIAELPYRIQWRLSLQSHPRFSTQSKANLRYEILRLADRMLGRSWNLEIVDAPVGASLGDPPTAAELRSTLAGKDKLIWLEVAAGPSTESIDCARIPVFAREYDVELEQWGPPIHEEVLAGPPLASELFNLAYRVFRPTAVFAKSTTSFSVDGVARGLALAPADGGLPLIPVGSPFHVYREFFDKEKRVSRNDVSWTYLVFEKPLTGGFGARFQVESGLRNPIGQRTRKKTRLVAVATGTLQNGVTTVRFVSGKEQRPVVGLQVIGRPHGQSTSVSLGNTDHRGEIDVRPVRLSTEIVAPSTQRLVLVTLLAGRNPLASFPLLPGDPDKLLVRVTVDPFLTELNGRLLALQEEVVDTVAKRTLGIKRVEKLAEKKDIDGAKKVADEINRLPGKAEFDAKLAKIKALAEDRRKEAKKANLGFSVQRMFTQTDYMLTEHFKAEKISLNFDAEGKADAKPSP